MADVFISYSRKDQEFVRILYQALQQHQLEAWVDWEGITPSAAWLSEIYAAIDSADTFLFVISPDSVASRVCNQEVEHAVQRNKRIVPILRRDLSPDPTTREALQLHPSIAKLNWIFFRDSDDFEEALEVLVRAIGTNLEWVRTHTRLLVRAIEWESKRRDNSLLLVGSDLRQAEVWLGQSGEQNNIGLTPLHTQYIYASRRAESMPTGTVTFLFTKVEDNTRLWDQHPHQMQSALAHYETILRQVIEAHGGYLFDVTQDSLHAAFPKAADALEAAIQGQRALEYGLKSALTVKSALADPSHGQEPLLVKVTMVLHTGATDVREGAYTGPTINRAEALLSAGHGGQVLVSVVTEEVLHNQLPEGVSLRDMGEHRLKDLTRPEHIFQVAAPGLPQEFPPLKTLDARPTNLPIQPTLLVGREKELATLGQLLRRPDVRLLTLTGPGGIGKTRLAVQVAAEMLNDFPDGVFFVSLAPIVDVNLVVPTIAYTFGLREAGGQPIAETLKNYLNEKRLLLVLDNFEQVVEAAPQVATLLKSAPGLKVLVSSRAALRLSMEREYGVPPLSVPDPKKLPALQALSQYAAVTLFIQRAEAVKPDFEMNNSNASAVAEICYRLEGIPLAIELAAARIKALSPQAILSRLGSRLKLLTGGARDLPARQQTLRGAIEWSYDLLSEEEKQLFRRIAVFRGGRTLEAAESVCNVDGDLEIDVLDGISSLADKSLMYVSDGADGDREPRYLMLETLHEYAWEKLQESGEANELRMSHAIYFVALAEEAESQLTRGQQAEWLVRLENEYDNIRTALEFLVVKSESAQALRVVGAIGRFWTVRGYLSEGLAWSRRVLELSDVVNFPALQAKVLNWAGNLARNAGDYPTARAFHEESLSIRRASGDVPGVARSLINLGNVALVLADYEQAESLFEQSLEISRQAKDTEQIGVVLSNLGVLARRRGDFGRAISLYEEAIALDEQRGDKRAVAFSLYNLASAVFLKGDIQRAEKLLRENLLVFQDLGDKFGTANVLCTLGHILVELSDHFRAAECYKASLTLFKELGTKDNVGECLTGTAKLFTIQGRAEAAAKLIGSADALRQSIGAPLPADEEVHNERLIALTRAQLDDTTWLKAQQDGRAMTIEQAIEYALQEQDLEVD